MLARRGARATNVFIGRAFVIQTFDRKFPDYHPNLHHLQHAFPFTLFDTPFHTDNRSIAKCGVWLEYASKTPLEVVVARPHVRNMYAAQSGIL